LHVFEVTDMGSAETRQITAHEYIKQKLKQIKKTQSMLAQEIPDDRITYYRRLKNELPMTDEFKNALYKALQLTTQETEELSRLLKIVQFGEHTVSLWEKIDAVFFNPASVSIPNYYIQSFEGGGRRYTANMLFDHIFPFSGKPDLSYDGKPVLSYEMTIINCVEPPIFLKLARLLEYVKALNIKGSVRHLVDIGQHDADNFDTISTLIFQIPKIQVENYTVYYRHVQNSYVNSLLGNSVLCSVSFGNSHKEKKHYWLVFSGHGDATCALLTDDIQNFIQNQLDDFQEEYNKLLFQSMNDEVIMRRLYAIHKDEQEAMLEFKSDLCFDMIPPGVYLSWRNRAFSEMEAAGMLFFSNALPNMGLNRALDYILEFQKKRYELTLVTKRIDVQSVNGLSDFARTGLLTDHIEGIPPLSGEETAAVLQNMHDRSRDPKDPYKLYITRCNVLDGKYIINAAKGGNVFIDLLCAKAEQDHKCVLIDSRPFSSLLFQYLENWLEPNYAMKPEDSGKFLQRLIAEARRRA